MASPITPHHQGQQQQGRQQQQQQQQQPHVVQTILDSFARCFAPPLDGCTASDPPPMRSGSSSGRKDGGAAFVVDGGGGDGDGQFTRAVSRSLSSSDSRWSVARRGVDGAHHRDEVDVVRRPSSSAEMAATTATAAGRHPADCGRRPSAQPPSAEELEERSMKRKLEIFRGGGWDAGTTGGPPARLAPRQAQQQQSRQLQEEQEHPRQRQQQRRPRPSSPPGSPAISDDDDDDEEILRLASSRGRFACGMSPFADTHGGRWGGNDGDGGPATPIASIGRMFGDIYGRGHRAAVSSGGFLCFATPVRTASGEEDASNLPDDRLTVDEFLSRHGRHGGGGGAGGPAAAFGGGVGVGVGVAVSPDSIAASCSSSPQYYGRQNTAHTTMEEESTANSTFYLDQKYSHVIQTRPPMPLFQENMLSCGDDGRPDELSRILKRRSTSADPPTAVTCVGGRRGATSPPIHSNMSHEYDRHHHGDHRRT